jgi:aminopeptidase-like protein
MNGVGKVTFSEIMQSLDQVQTGRQMHDLITELYPICRSITGDGLRKTLEILRNHIPLKIYEVPSGMKVFDWVVPKEWNISAAYIKDPSGKKIVDFKDSNLYVVNYSKPLHKTMPLQELSEHLYSIPGHPTWIPYRTSYYREDWGFCLSHDRLAELEEGAYEVYIDSTLEDGHLSYGELYLQGEEEEEVLISCHACHPSLANDNLSGMSLAVFLAKQIGSVKHRFSYRFLFIPGTIGAITWLALNEDRIEKIRHGLVLSGVGDKGAITYKRSRQGDAEIDRAAGHVLKHSRDAYEILDYSPYGYDERQYCSPGFDLPVGCFSRTPFGRYPEYHTSADNLDFVLPSSLGDSFIKVLSIIGVLEGNRVYLNLNPKCEPQLGRRGLYHSIGSNEMAMLWVLNFSDGKNTLLDIAERADLKFDAVFSAAETLRDNNLLKKVVL